MGSPGYLKLVLFTRRILNQLFHGKGMYQVHRVISKLWPYEQRLVNVNLDAASVFVFEASDSYYGHYLLDGRPYEPEISWLIEGIQDLSWGFVDAGANFGYWSVAVTSPHRGSHQAVAIEASKSNFDKLRVNCEANQRRFRTVHAAVHSVSGTRMFFNPVRSHASGSASQSPQPGRAECIASVSIDDAVVESFDPALPVVVKIDVEGTERDALEGARVTLTSRDAVAVVESHGKDRSSDALSWGFDNGFSIVFVHDDGSVSRLLQVDDALALKVNRRRGYNFLMYEASSSGVIPCRINAWVKRGRVRPT